MDYSIDRELMHIADGLYTAKPHDELDSILLFREEELDAALDDIFDGLTS